MVSIVGTYAESGSDTGEAGNTAVIVCKYLKKIQPKRRIRCRYIQYNDGFWERRRRRRRRKKEAAKLTDKQEKVREDQVLFLG